MKLHPEEFAEQDLVGLESHKCLAEMNEDGDVEYTIGFEVDVLDPIVLEHSFQEVGRQKGEPTLHESREHGILSGFLSIRYGSPVVARHRSITFLWRKPLLTRARRSLVLNFAFFHFFDGFGGVKCGGNNDDCPASPALS
jgi:hypothetical protein